MKYFLKPFLIMIVIALFVSCSEDIVEVDLSEHENQIVIEGNIIQGNGPHDIKISEVVRLNNFDEFPPIIGANVLIEDDRGNSESLIEIRPGLYRSSNIVGVPGNSYRMFVEYLGEIYSAVSKMPEELRIDSVFFRRSFSWINNFDLSIYFTDRPNVEEFLRIKIFKNNSFLFDNHYLYQSKHTDGKLVKIDDFQNNFFVNDDIKIEFHTISKDTYEYFSTLVGDEKVVDPETPDFLPLTLFNAKSNISNGALGYFSAHFVRSRNFHLR